MSNHPPYREQGEKTPDIFTRLSIAMCPQDDGTRPVNPTWTGSDIGYLSPAIQFSSFPLPAGEPSQVKIVIDNLGTADASPVTLETAYNIYIGNQAATMINVQNVTIPLIPAGCTHTAVVIWTPPDVFIAHACFHARVFDSYSMKQYPSRCFSWDSYINPQAGSHNMILLKVADPNQAIVVTYPVINIAAFAIEPKLLMTVIDDRARFNHFTERFPLPFVPEHLTSTSIIGKMDFRSIELYAADLSNMSSRSAAGVARGETGRVGRIPGIATSRRWPSKEVDRRFIHHRFGFDVNAALDLPGGRLGLRREVFHTPQPLAAVQLDSYIRMRLVPNETKIVRLVIPSSEFPPPGRRKKFQVDYQIGDERPTQNFLYLYH